MMSALGLLLYGLAVAGVLGAVGMYSIRAQREDAAKRRHAWDEYRRHGLSLTGAEVTDWLDRLDPDVDVEPPVSSANKSAT